MGEEEEGGTERQRRVGRLLTFFHSFSLAQWRTFSARSLETLMEGQAKDDPKQGPPAVPSGNGGGRCHWAGAEGTLPSARGGACLCSILRARRMGPCSSAGVGRSSAHLSPECRHAGVAPQGRTSPGRGRTPAGQQPLNTVLRGHGASAAVHSLEEDRARAGPGCHGVTLALRILRAGAAEQELWFQLPAPCLSCRTAQHCTAGAPEYPAPTRTSDRGDILESCQQDSTSGAQGSP
ncbi:uncharacterized protein M6G45_015705 [Spheniscus humboldti]